ncbi:flavin reductase family protein [Planosporangium sp. 12N6]|uniref:flavin reductase family protein n=1 Tax=Planosporangium spinosum TaxID=3402278 RepID=UPI003CEC039E
MTISPSDPFATPDHLRSPVRRLRGRLPSAVTLWTARDGRGAPVGLTVSSTLVVDGDPARLLGVVDEESELWAAIEDTRRFAVTVLASDDRQLADRFAGLMPAPGGLFAGDGWRESGYGPVPAGRETLAGCRLDGARPVGWGLLVEATIETVALGGAEAPLVHYRGRYRDLA